MACHVSGSPEPVCERETPLLVHDPDARDGETCTVYVRSGRVAGRVKVHCAEVPECARLSGIAEYTYGSRPNAYFTRFVTPSDAGIALSPTRLDAAFGPNHEYAHPA